jgi:hypothetical protein
MLYLELTWLAKTIMVKAATVRRRYTGLFNMVKKDTSDVYHLDEMRHGLIGEEWAGLESY